MRWVLLTLAVLLGIAVAIWLQRPMGAAAEGWPGSPVALAVTVIVVHQVAGVLAACVYGFRRAPDRAPAWAQGIFYPAHGSRVVGVTTAVAVGAAVLWGLSLVFLVGVFLSGSADEVTSCSVNRLGCWYREASPGFGGVALLLWLVTLVAAVLTVQQVSARDGAERRRGAVAVLAAVVGVVGLPATVVLFDELGASLAALAQRTPGGVLVFFTVAGLVVALLPFLVFRLSGRSPRPGAWQALGAVLALAGLLFLFTLLPPRDYPGPILCDRGVHCHLDQAGRDATGAWVAGWLGAAAGLGGLFLRYRVPRGERS